MLWQAILGGEIGWDLQGIESCNSKTFAQNNYLLIQQAAFSIATFQALTEEYDVYYYGTSSEVRVYPDDLASISVRIQELFDVEESGLKRFANDTSIRGAKIDCDDKLQQFLTKLIAEVEAASGLFRQQLSMNLFQDAQYKKNLEGLVKAGTLEEPPDLSDYPDLYEILRFNNPSAQIIEAGSVETNGTKKDLIEVRKGIFNLVFVQEGAQLKILFAMPTRIVD